MASTPTTKSQVQAYRFVLRRMQSALVRKDAVMLHDPMRNHSRATVIGVVLGCVGLLGFTVFGFFSPSPQPPDEGIVISKESGAVYVVQKEPHLLIPMTNLASARLFLFAQQTPDAAQANGQGGGDAPAGAVGSNGPSGGAVKVVSEASLSKLARGRLTGIADGPELLPTPDQRIGSNWMVCDQTQLDQSLPDPTQQKKFTTTVLAGVSGGGDSLDGTKALLLVAPNQKAYLVYRAPSTSVHPNAKAVRAEIDLADAAVKSAFNLTGKSPRPASAGLLSAIPEASKLTAPTIAGRGSQADYLASTTIGDVIEVDRTGGAKEFYVALQDGLQKVPQAVGDLIRYKYSSGSQPRIVPPDQIASAKITASPLKLEDYPTEVPQVVDTTPSNQAVCLGWSAQGKDERTEVLTGSKLPISADTPPVMINQPGADGQTLAGFFITPGKAAVVRSTSSSQDFDRGPIQLITPRGVKFGIPDTKTSAALGLGDNNFAAAPDAILRLLPAGTELNRNGAIRSYDSMQVQPGVLASNLNQGQGR
ncbi:type VII secretion protein EccB [Solihabitans fulvus]|uniref:Type VII secretion protein EccB n=1 Tax=Solihabitans fulvus TaxID=1892852 RepID=A0A5B2XP73_9PSEU|nr:type VII secretion protein EccB [Solihabitans fulvus]KAA2264701.1 type VII secretion protein EccB [Solihabitans fulvus]